MEKNSEPLIIRLGNEDVMVPSSYNPLTDKDVYMNKTQLGFFKKILLDWKKGLEEKTLETIESLGQEKIDKISSEDGDRADDEVETLTVLRTRDRYRKLMNKIDAAILKIETGNYGYCEKSGEEIGIKRLLARPIATLCIAMQKLHEQDEDAKEDAEYNNKIIKMEDSDEEEE